MPITRRTISLDWLTEQNACNLEALSKYFESRGATEFELTPEGILRVHQAGLLSCNWLARRILTGPELAEYEREMHEAMGVFERTMAPILIEIIKRASNLPKQE